MQQRSLRSVRSRARRDGSNLRISESESANTSLITLCSGWLNGCGPSDLGVRRLFKKCGPRTLQFEMRKFESCAPGGESSCIPILRCGGSNPPAPANV